MLQPQPYSTASSASNNSISTHNTPHVLILGVGIGSEIFIRELLSNHIHLVVVDKHPILSTETMKQGKDSGLLTIITLDFAHLEQVETALAKLDFPITHTLSLPVGRALTFLGTLNDRYHFAGPSLATIDACTDKVKFHQLLQAHGLNNPRYLVLPPRTEKHNSSHPLALSPDEIQQAQSQLGFPLIIKPACGSGSQGVRYCTDSSALKTYLLPERFAHQPLLLEEVISGQEYSTNFFVDENSEIHMFGLYAKEMSSLPFRQEVAYFVDDFSEAFSQIYPYIKQIVAALGSDVRSTFFNADVIINHKGMPYAIDVAPRLGGNALLLLEQFCHMSPIKLFVQHVLKGLPLSVSAHLPLPPQKAVLRFFSFAHAGTVRALTPKLTSKEQSHIVSCQNHLYVGSTVGTMPDGRGLAQGHIMIAHDDLTQANNLTHKYLDSFVIAPKQSSINVITYEDNDHCPLCGSKHFTVLPEHHEVIQATPLPANELEQNAIVKFTPVLCEHCGVSFNIKGLSAQSRNLISRNYKSIKASIGMGAGNYQTYIDTVKEAAQNLH